MNNKLQAMLASYGRSVLAGAASLYMAGVTDPKDLAYSLIAAIAPVAIRYINPNDLAFGKIPSVEEVDSAIKTAKPKKAVKKAAPKKPAAKK